MTRQYRWFLIAVLGGIAWIGWGTQPLRAQSLDELGDVFGENTKEEGEAKPEGAEEEPPAEGGQTDGLLDPFNQETGETAEEGQRTLDDVMAEAKQKYDAGDYAGAAEIYGAILAQYPNVYAAALEQGRALVQLKEFDLALNAFQNAMDFGSVDPAFVAVAATERAKVLLRQGSSTEALADISSALSNTPANAELLFLRGKALNRIGQQSGPDGFQSFEQALSSLNRAISIDSENAEYFAERALARAALREFDFAISDTEKAVELDPENVDLRARRGVLYSRRGGFESRRFEANTDRAIADLEASIKSFDEFLEKAEGKTRDDFREAEPEAFTPSQIYDEKASALLALAAEVSAERARGLYRDVIQVSDQALEFDDRSYTAHYRKGLARRLLGDYRAAVVDFSQSLALSRSPETLLRRGIAFYYLGEYARARADFRESLITRASPDGRIRFWIGATFAAEGRFLDAIQWYTESIRENPDYQPAYKNRALAYMQIRDFRRAANDFEEVIRRDDRDQVALQRRDLALQRANAAGQ